MSMSDPLAVTGSTAGFNSYAFAHGENQAPAYRDSFQPCQEGRRINRGSLAGCRLRAAIW
jgi:hypothetical protein